MNISDLPTPSFIVDWARLTRNCDKMRTKAERAGVVFRPHVKSHKSSAIGRLQHGGRTGPITVSTLAEARHFADDAFDDITYAVPIAPAKLAEAAALASRIRRLNILVDHIETLRAVETFARGEGVVFDLFLKVDCGYHRAGVDPSSAQALELASAALESPQIRLRGLLTHAGHSYNAKTLEEIAAIASQEAAAVSAFARRLPDSESRSLVRSVGSTPTLSVAAISDCDEVRPGNYVFYDAYQAQLGSCRFDDVAVSVLATVVGIYPEQKKVIVDAGSLALTRESAYAQGNGFGIVCDESLRPRDLHFTAMSQEHGQLFGAGVQSLAIGSRVRVVPNHSCITAAMFDRYFVVEGERVVDEWKPVRGW